MLDSLPKAEDKVGFGAIRSQLRAHVLCALGEDRLAELQASSIRNEIQAELARVAELQAALEHGNALPLAGFLDVREVLRRAAPEMALVGPEDLRAVQMVCRCMRRLRAYFAKRPYPVLARLTARITVLRELEDYLDEIVNVDGAVRDDASRELRRLRRLIPLRRDALRLRLREVLLLAHAKGYATELQPTVRGGRMVIPLRAEAKRKVRGFIHDTSATGQTVYMEPEACLDLNNEIRLLEAEERREMERILREATARVQARGDELAVNLVCLAQFDLLQAKAHLANRMRAVVPKFNDDGIVDIRDGRNPALLLYQGEAVVPLNLVLGLTAGTLVITGPNAGGKTVAMKTVGLLSLMLAYGIPVPVHPASSFYPFEGLLVEIGDEQSMENDLSTFSSRIQGLRRMLELANPRTLILIDEIGTGTDPAGGAALAQAALEHLTESGARTVVTTHHGTLKGFAHEAHGVENGSMEFNQETLRPTFRFRQGVPGSSYAFKIAARLGLDPGVLERARALLGTQAAALEDLIATFECRSQELLVRLQRPAGRLVVRRRARLVRAAPAGGVRRARKSAQRGRKPKQRRKTLPPASEPWRPAHGGKRLHVGDRVVLDSGASEGEIIEIDGPKAVVAFGAMRVYAATERLSVAVGHRARALQQSSDYGSDAQAGIDLRGCRVDEAVRSVEKLVDKALAANIRVLEIVHGKGSGALREAIHAYLETVESVAAFGSLPTNAGLTRVELAGAADSG